MGYKFFIFLIIILILINGIYMALAGPVLPDNSPVGGTGSGTSTTTGTTPSNTGATGGDIKTLAPEDVKKITTPPDTFNNYVKGAADVGTVVAGKNTDKTPTLKPEDVKTDGLVHLEKKDEKTKVGFAEESSKLNIKGREFTGFDDPFGSSNVKLDKNAKVQSAELDVNKKGGTALSLGGIDFHAPKDSKVLMPEDKTKPIQVELKEKSKIETIPKKRERKENEEEQRTLQYRSLNGFTTLPDQFAEQMGFKGKPVDFKGIFSWDGNWYIDKQQNAILRIDGKEIPMQNLYEYKVTDPNDGKLKTLTGVNEKAYFFAGKDSFNTAVENGFKGAYFVADKDGIGGGSNNDLAGHSLRIQESNPWGIKVEKNGYVAGWSLKNSNYFFNQNSQIITNGKVVIDDDYLYYRTDPDNNKIFFNQGARVPGFDNGDVTKFKDSINSPLKLLPYNNNQALPFKSGVEIGLSTDPDPNKASNFRVVPMQGTEPGMARVIFGEMPKDSGGNFVPPATKLPGTPVQPGPPGQTNVDWSKPSNWGKCTGSGCMGGDYSGIMERYALNDEYGGKYDPSKQTKGIIIKIGSRWCAACRTTDPGFDDIAKQNQGLAKFAHINVGNEVESLSKLGIFGTNLGGSIPSILYLKDGQASVLRMQKGESPQGFLNRVEGLVK